MTGGSKLLKQGLARAVRLERRGEDNVVVKRFEHSGRVGRAFDGLRARREFAVLQYLSDAGLDVPRPLRLVRHGRAHEVEIEWIEGARSLAEMLSAKAKLTTGLARRLGTLLAGLHSSGVDHPDLHAGNVLVTAQGRAIAVDFDKARLVHALTQAKLVRDLVSLCAGLREATGPGWRAIAFESWWAALDAHLRDSLSKPDAHEIERLARTRRRHVVEERARRWTRTGSAVVALAESKGFARVGLESAQIERVLRNEAPSGSHIRVEGSRSQVVALWRSMARLEEHAIAAPRCRVLITRSSARAWFALDPARAPATAAERGRFVGSLFDRGLWCEGLEPRDIDGSGLIRPRRLTSLDASFARATLAPWLADLDGKARQEFFSGLRAALRSGARERDAALANLEHG